MKDSIDPAHILHVFLLIKFKGAYTNKLSPMVRFHMANPTHYETPDGTDVQIYTIEEV